MRLVPLACAAALALLPPAEAFAMEGGAPASMAEMKPNKASSPAAPSDAAARSAKSIECSQKADAENLHGKQRKLFMRECKHGG